MKEIQFRAWDSVQKKMWFDMVIDFQGNIIDAGEVRNYRMELMQYTGLKDKHGKEIYEGDIVRHNDYGKYKEIIYEKYIDDFDNGHIHPGFILKGDDNPWSTDMSKCEVVGNIYENTNLLKEEK